MVTWINPNSDLWENGANWSSGSVPASGDDVAINTAGITITVTAPETVHNLANAGANIAIGSSNTLTVAGSFAWNSGTLTGPGSLAIASTGTMTISASVALDGATLDNEGAVTWSSGIIYTYNSPVIDNHGTWDAQADAYFDDVGNANRGSFNNYGTLSRTAGTGTAYFDQVYFNNLGGSVNVASTILVVAGGASTGGSFDVTGGATLDFLGSLAGDTQMFTGMYTGTGTGTVEFGGGSLTLAGGSSGATFAFAPLFLWTGGTLGGPGTLTNSGSMEINGSVNMNGSTLDNEGSLVWSSGVIYTYNSPVIDNHGTWDAQADAYFDDVSNANRGSFNNYGTISRSTGTGTAFFDQVFFNNRGGSINVASTILVVAGGASTGGSFDVTPGATLEFWGSLAGDTQMLTGMYTGTGTGTVEFAGGTLTLAANTSGATLDFAPLFQWTSGTLGGPGALTNSGTMEINGSVNMNGSTLDNEGTLRWSSGVIYTYNAPVIDNHGTWDAQADAYFDDVSNANRGSFNNYGTVSRTSGTGTAFFDQVFFNNLGGFINVASTKLVVASGASTGGNFTASPNATLLFQGYFSGDTQTLTGTYLGSGAGTVAFGSGLIVAAGAAGATLDCAPGLLQWSGGTIAGPGILTSTGALTISGGGALNGATLDNQGTVVWTAGVISTYNTPVIDNHGIWDAQADSYFDDVSNANRGSFNNYGTLSRTTGTGTAFLDQVYFNNQGGSINVASTTLVVPGGSSTGGHFTASAGGTLLFQAYYSGDTQTFTGTYTGSGSGTVALGSGLTVAIGVAGATFDFGPGLFQLSGGAIAGPGTLTNLGALGISNGGSLSGAILDNEGTVVWTGGVIYTYNTPVINNHGTWDARAGSYFDDVSNANRGSFNNYGTLSRTTGTGTAYFDQVYFNNLGGSINVASTTLVVPGGVSTGGNFLASAGATLLFEAYFGGDTQTFTGTYTGSGAGTVRLTGGMPLIIGAAGATLNFAPGLFQWSNGPISGPGTLTNAGSLTLAGSATLYLDPAALVNSGTLTVSANLTLDIGSAGKTTSAENTGSLGAAGGGVIDLNCPLAVDGSGFLAGQTSGTLFVRGNLTGGTTNTELYAPAQPVLFAGSGTPVNPQLLEVMSQDQGANGAAFAKNFTYDQVVITNYTYVRLVDQAQNAAAPGTESLYVNSLVVQNGATLDLNGLHVYSRDTQINGTVVGGTVTTLPSGGPVALNTPSPGNIVAAGKVDDWTFFGRAGQTISVIASPANAPLSPNLNYAQVTVLDASSNVLASGSSANSGDVVSLLDVALPADGTYHVRVQAPNSQASETGHYLLAVYDAPVHVRTMELGQQVVGQIATAYSIDRWTFSAPANTAVQFQWINASGPLQFSLEGPGGWTGFSGLTGNSGPVTLPTAGTYTLDASSAGDLGGAYAFRMVQLSVAQLTPGKPFNGTLAGSGQAQLFQVTLPVTEQLLVTLTDSSSADHNEVYAKYGAPPTRADYQYRFSTPAAANQQVLVPTATAGTWYILVYDDVVPAPGSFNLTASVASVFLTGVTPASQGTAADAMLILSGVGFTPAPAISLVAPDGTVYPAARVTANSATQLVAIFTAGSVPAGVYTVRATAADGSTADLPGAFTLIAGGKAVLSTNIIVPNPIGYHIASTIYVDYTNTGNVPMPAPMLVVTGTMNGLQGALLTLDASKQTAGFWTSATPAGFAQSVEFLASGAQPGILQPGESEQVPVYYAGWLHSQWDFSRPPITFTVGVLGADDSQTVDWASMESSMRPASIGSGAWTALYPNLSSQLGTTWGSYVRRLDADAQYLAGIGETVTDIDQLLGFELQQANGYSALASLAAATDARVSAPGLALDLARNFAPGIIARNAFGPFGWGWFDPWQSSLSTQADGTVVVALPGGGQRTFQPDSRPGGAYFAPPGDHGILAGEPGGGYTLTEANGYVTAYNRDGSLNYVQDADGNRITAGYTGGQLTSLTHSSGQSLDLAYNTAGLISSVTDSAGRTTTYHYDAGNQYLTSVENFNGATTTYTYDTGANPLTAHALASIAFPDGTHDYFTYDSQGRLSDIHHDAGAEDTTFAYSAGEVNVADALGDTTKYYFDNRGLLLEVQNPLGDSVRAAYDQNFNRVRTTDALGRTYTYVYDALGNLLSATDPLGDTVRATYTAVNNRLASLTDANGNTTRYAYDGKGDLTSTTYADGSVARAAYDPIGSLLTAMNRRGQASHFTYDAAGNMLTATYADGSMATYTYDAHENLTSATDASGTTRLTYDANDRLAQITYPSGRYLKYTYDGAGRRIQMVDQTGFTVNYGYDAAGRLATLTDGSGNPMAKYAYDAAGRLSRTDNGNLTYTTYVYDAAGELLQLVNFAPDGTPSSKFSYTYDSLGRQITEATMDGTWTYSYDAIGELTRAVFTATNPLVANQDLAYAYDAAGNRTQTNINGTTTTYLANSLNEYTQVGGTTYGYDADGNQISATDVSGTTAYTYDTQDRLTGVSGPSQSWTYQYDAFGNRSASVQNGQHANFLVDPYGLGDVVGEFDGTGTVVAHYVWGLGLASRVDATGTPAYYDFNGAGSTVGVSGATGSYLNTYRYLPFGESVATGSLPNPFQVIGRFGVMADGDGLTSMRARSYDPSQGRFVQMDPLGIAGGLNLYRYADSNPVSEIDPSGLAGIYYDSRFDTHGDFGPDDVTEYRIVLPGHTGGGPSYSMPASVPTGGGSFIYFPTTVVAIQLPGCDNFTFTIPGQWGPRGHLDWQTAPPPTAPGCFPPAPPPDDDPPPDEEPPPDDTPPPAQAPAEPGGGGSSQNTGSHDPNAKFGPAGYGPSHFVAATAVLPYRVDFENDPTATAPAQIVTVTDQLDSNLNWSAFALTEVGFGDTNISIPAGSQHFQTTVETTENGQTFQVQIELGLNALTGQVFATFYSIDPQTGLPPANVLTGFLPPEDGSGRGMGYFTYTVQSKLGLATGTQIRNVAVVTFDNNPAIATDQADEHDPSKGVDPAKQALVTIDSGAPTSRVNPLPAASLASIPVSWSGQDDAGGSGVASYDIYVSENGGPWQLWKRDTAQTSAVYAGQLGHGYTFYSVATDNAGNQEVKAAAIEGQTHTPVLETTATAPAGAAPPTVKIATLLGTHYSDPDKNTKPGIAVTTLTGNGTWQYSTNGKSWVNIAAPVGTNALLLPASDSLRFVPAGLWTGEADLLYVAWDGSGGSAGSYAGTGTGGGATPFSSAAGMLAVTIAPAAHAPILLAGSTTLAPVLLGDANPAGQTIDQAFGGLISVGAGRSTGIAVVGLTATAKQGTWQYRISSGGWQSFPRITASTAFLLGNQDMVRFLPAAGFAGSVSLQVRAWDGSTGSRGSTVDLSKSSSIGGTTAYSGTILIGLLHVNHAPTQGPPAAGIVLAATLENVASKAIPIATLLHDAQAADADKGTRLGLAVTAASGPGVWQYQLGRGWQPVPATAALLLPPSALLRFEPAIDQSGTASLTWRAWDQTQGSSGILYAVTVTGDPAAFSTATGTATLAVTPATGHLPPGWTATGATLMPVLPGTTNPSGDTIANIFGAYFQPSPGSVGIAVTALSGASGGVWQYSLDGTTWNAIANVSPTKALLLSATYRIRFVPKAGFLGTAALTAYAWDASTGTAGTVASIHSSSAFSRTAMTATCLVNTAPVLQP
jgi:RHS repeat-associated protein